MMRKYLLSLLGMLALAVTGYAAECEFRIAEVFCDNMVLQRDAAVPVWGWAKPGQRVTVQFAGQTQAVSAGQDGKWTVTFDPMPACSDQKAMTISVNGKKLKTIDGVLIGDVWLCSGQSNMVYGFGASKRPQGYPLNNPLIREFTAPRTFSLKREDSYRPPSVITPSPIFHPTKKWLVCSPSTAGKFTAVGLFAAKEMFSKLKIPIGIINCSYNGSRAVLWTPADILKKNPRYDTVFKKADRQIDHYRKSIDQYKRDQGLFNDMKRELAQPDNVASSDGDTCVKGLRNGWMKPEIDTKNWIKLPWGYYYGLPNYVWDGPSVIWFRTLCLAGKTKGDIHILGGDFRNCQVQYFFNGRKLKEIGRTADGQPEFVIKQSELVNRRGQLAVRAFSNYGIACLWRAPHQKVRKEMRVLFAEHSLYRVAEYKKSATPFRLAGHKYPPRGAGEYPGSRFNAMLNPLIPYALKGFIWYQGESECFGGIDNARLYAHTLPLLVRAWRDVWGGGDTPFVVVQLASYPYGSQALVAHRESQKAVLSLPNTGLSPSMDIREPGNVHPRNKYDIGIRAGRMALKIACGEEIVASGPMSKSMKIEGRKARIFFDHVGAGLAVGDKEGLEPVKFLPVKKVPHFQIAGKDGKFVPAEAEIDGDTVLVWKDGISEPAAVRYAWTNMPENPLLYNRQGLPACSFSLTKNGIAWPDNSKTR